MSKKVASCDATFCSFRRCSTNLPECTHSSTIRASFVLLGGMVMTNGTKDSVGDWLKWLFAAAIIASFSFPIRFAFSPETYAKLSGTQEFMLFCLEVVGIAYFVVRPFAKSRVQDRR